MKSRRHDDFSDKYRDKYGRLAKPIIDYIIHTMDLGWYDVHFKPSEDDIYNEKHNLKSLYSIVTRGSSGEIANKLAESLMIKYNKNLNDTVKIARLVEKSIRDLEYWFPNIATHASFDLNPEFFTTPKGVSDYKKMVSDISSKVTSSRLLFGGRQSINHVFFLTKELWAAGGTPKQVSKLIEDLADDTKELPIDKAGYNVIVKQYLKESCLINPTGSLREYIDSQQF